MTVPVILCPSPLVSIVTKYETKWTEMIVDAKLCDNANMRRRIETNDHMVQLLRTRDEDEENRQQDAMKHRHSHHTHLLTLLHVLASPYLRQQDRIKQHTGYLLLSRMLISRQLPPSINIVHPRIVITPKTVPDTPEHHIRH